MGKSTRQRTAIRDALAAAQRPLTPQEVLHDAQERVAEMGLATVYRSLKLLVDEGVVQVVNLPDENPRYEIATHVHHHHFQCNYCRRVYDVYGCPGDMKHLAPDGFTVEQHDLTLYGRCADCNSRAVHASANNFSFIR